MSRDVDDLLHAETASTVGARSSVDLRRTGGTYTVAPRMQYRSRPVSVAVDPVSLVMSECISITSAIQKHARSPHSSVSAILGGSPNPINLGSPNPSPRGTSKTSGAGLGTDGAQDIGSANRWGLRGKKGRSIQDNPLMAGFGKLRHELASVRGRMYIPMLPDTTYQVFAGAVLLTISRFRYPLVRCPVSPESVLADNSDQRHCCAYNDSHAGGFTQVSGLRLH